MSNRRCLHLVLVLLVLAVLALGSCRERQGGRGKKPDWVEVTSTTLHVTFTYDRNVFTDLVESSTAEFPVRLVSRHYTLGLKRLSGVGGFLAKEPGSDFFKFFSGGIVRSFIDHNGMSLLEQETLEDFTAQGRPGVVQFLHMQLPEKRSRVPAYIPSDVEEVYLYYFHYYFPPDYWYFAAIARQRLSPEDIAYIVSFIDRVDFTWRPAETEAGEPEP